MNTLAGPIPEWPHICSQCQHYERGYTDNSTGYHNPDECNAVDRLALNGEITEQAAVFLTGIMFAFSELAGKHIINQCPGFASIHKQEWERHSELWARNDEAQSLTPDKPSVWGNTFGSSQGDLLVTDEERAQENEYWTQRDAERQAQHDAEAVAPDSNEEYDDGNAPTVGNETW